MDPGVGSCQRFCFKLMHFPVRSLAQGIDCSRQDSSVTSVSMQRVSVKSMSHCWSCSCSTTVESFSVLAACMDILRACAFRERYESQTSWIGFEGTFTLKTHLPEQTHTSTLVYLAKILRQLKRLCQVQGEQQEQRQWPRCAAEVPHPTHPQQQHSLVCKNTNLSLKLQIIEDFINFFFLPPANTTFASIMHPDDLNL